MARKSAFIWVLFLWSVQVAGQDVNVSGRFLRDTVKIGEEVPYSLSVSYPRSYNIIFPDSGYNYRPFEYHHREYFRTMSDSSTSFDSAVYYLSTFEIDTVQYLQLPVYINQTGDSSEVFSRADSIYLFHVIQVMPDSVKLKENTAFLKVRNLFNYPLFLLIGGIIIVLILLGIIFFGKRLKRWIVMIIMRRSHKRFVRKYFFKLGALKDQRAGVEPEELLTDWKKYMEKLEREPYTKLTTKELIGLHADQRLKENLRSVDRYIYGSIKDKPLHENFEKLLEYSIERYEVRLNELRNG